MLANLRYFAALLCAVFRSPPRSEPRRSLVRPLLLLMLLSMSLAAWTMAGEAASADSRSDAAAELAWRIERVATLFDRTEHAVEQEIAPVVRVLRSQGADERLARRVATALVTEARRTRLEPRLLLGVLLVENPMIDPTARSPVGAQGLMQVMPFHRGNWRPCPPRLDDIEANICHGAQIFAHYLQAERGNLERALLRYNGCVRGTNTPNCHSYPMHVFARTGRATIHDWRQSRNAAIPAP
jgi:soluble lytic murein transglycosylase-like protein